MTYIVAWSVQEPYVTTRSVSISPQYDTLKEAVEAALAKIVRVAKNIGINAGEFSTSLAYSALNDCHVREFTLHGGDWGQAVFRIFEMPDSDIVDDWVQVYL